MVLKGAAAAAADLYTHCKLSAACSPSIFRHQQHLSSPLPYLSSPLAAAEAIPFFPSFLPAIFRPFSSVPPLLSYDAIFQFSLVCLPQLLRHMVSVERLNEC